MTQSNNSRATWQHHSLIIAAVGLALTSAYCSVQGFSEVFGSAGNTANIIVVYAIAICLEIGKVAVTGVLMTHWSIANRIQRTFLGTALAILMTSNAVYSYGFFLNAYQIGSVNAQNMESIKASATMRLETAQADLHTLQQEIDAVPGTMPTGKAKLQASLAPQMTLDRETINQAQKDILDAQMNALTAATKAGPLAAAAAKLHMTADQLANRIICATVIVFDPLAVALISIQALLDNKELNRRLRIQEREENQTDKLPKAPRSRKGQSKRSKARARTDVEEILKETATVTA